MEGNVTLSKIRESFRTPVRILLPKLLKSRNGWKAKSSPGRIQSGENQDPGLLGQPRPNPSHGSPLPCSKV